MIILQEIQEIFHSFFLFFEGYWLRKTPNGKHHRNPDGDSTGVNVMYLNNCKIEAHVTGDMALLGHEVELHNFSLELLAS